MKRKRNGPFKEKIWMKQLSSRTTQLTEGMKCLLFPGKRSQRERLEDKAKKLLAVNSILPGSKNFHCVTTSMEMLSPVRVPFTRTCTLCVSILTSDSVAKAWSEWLSQRKVTLSTVWKLPYTAFDCFQDQSLTSKTCWTQRRGLTSATLASHSPTEPKPLRAVAITDSCSI